MRKILLDYLQEFINEANENNDNVSIERWSAKVARFLATAIGEEESSSFLSVEIKQQWGAPDYHGTLASRVGHLQGLVAKISAESQLATVESSAHSIGRQINNNSRRIFVVHGHDNEAKESTARFLERIKLEPIILHEQVNSGQTIIEKFETHSADVSFAVVLLTPDDLGSAVNSSHELNKRARQNVIMELGYFIGRLSRDRVCALYKDEVELPSDYQGVLYIEMDEGGAWRTKLAQELVRAKLPIDLNGLLTT